MSIPCDGCPTPSHCRGMSAGGERLPCEPSGEALSYEIPEAVARGAVPPPMPPPMPLLEAADQVIRHWRVAGVKGFEAAIQMLERVAERERACALPADLAARPASAPG